VTAACKTPASVLLAKIQNISFIFLLELLYICFKNTNVLCELLQSIDIDIMKAQMLYQVTVNNLKYMKTEDYYKNFYEQVMIKVNANGIENETRHGNKRGRRRTVELSKEEEFNVIYCSVIDSFIGELNFRFKEDNIRPLVVIHKLITVAKLDPELNIRKELEIYESEIDFDDLEMNLTHWYEYKELNPKQFASASFRHTADQFINCSLHENLKELYTLFLIYLTVPISSATGERSFSVLKLLKTYIRNTISQQRLSDLAVISVNSDLLSCINLDDIINKFASIKDRRLKFTI